MAAKTTEFGNDLLRHIFLNEAIALIGDANGLQPSASAGSFWLSLHTADPGVAGAQNTSEATYGSYARVEVARTSTNWLVTNGVASNKLEILFPKCTGSSSTITHAAVGTASSGAGKLLFRAQVTIQKSITTNDVPRYEVGQLTFSET